MRQYLLSALVIISFVLVLPFTYGGCSDGGGGGNGGGGGGGGGGGDDIVIDADDIGGTVFTNGEPEAGVWVIAQADVGNTNYRKIVVTNNQGRFVIPDLPEAIYDVWVRGYGLVDSNPVQVSPGELIDLEAMPASSPQEAAEVYPGNYWYSLLEPPDGSMFPGTGPDGNGIPTEIETQSEWVSLLKRGSCATCHTLGDQHTRGHDRVTPELWQQVWQLPQMSGPSNRLGREVAAEVFSDWVARIAGGEVPPEPPKPQGIERNFVITQWDWGDGITYAHDEIATDKRNPTLYPHGTVYGVDFNTPRFVFVDPVTNEVGEVEAPYVPGFEPAEEIVRGSGGHNPMLDDNGRLWLTRDIDPTATEADQPAFCTDGSRGDILLPGAVDRELAYYDTVTDEWALIPLCVRTHHLQFDFNGLLWVSTNSSGPAAYWFDPSKFDPDNPATLAEAQDWREFKADSDGDGVGDATADINGQPLTSGYGLIPNPVDGSIWYANGGFPGQIVRYDPTTELSEVYVPPAPGLSPRGIDAATDGTIWTCLADSSHVARFDRGKCAQTWGLGDQCPEGWTLWETPGPHFKGIPEAPGSADPHYFAWVDQFNTLGLGENMVVCTGTFSDSQIVFNPETEEFITIRTPFPLSMFTRGLDGRIDDPDAGWKGRGWWLDNGKDPISHNHHEDRHGVIGWIQQVQLRPDPLAK